MNVEPFFRLKGKGGLALPAVLKTPAHDAVEVRVILDRDEATSNLDGMAIENAIVKAQVQSRELAGLTLTNSGDIAGNTTLKIDELWEDDDGNPVHDENDEPIYAAAQYQYNVKRKHKDVEGVTKLELTEN